MALESFYHNVDTCIYIFHDPLADGDGTWSSYLYLCHKQDICNLCTFYVAEIHDTYKKNKLRYQNVDRLDIVYSIWISRNLYITLTNMRSVILELVHKICTATILHCQLGRVIYLSRDQALILHSLYDVSSCVHTQGSLVPNFYRIRYIFEHFPGC